MRYIFTTLLTIFCLSICAQIDIPAGMPVVNGYDITYTNPNLNGETLYLCGNYGNQLFVVDSAVVKKGIASFHNKKAVLPCGVYTLSKDPQDYLFSKWNNSISVVLNKSNQVQISQEGSFSYHQAQDLKVTGSEETTLLNRFLYNICNSAAVVDPDFVAYERFIANPESAVSALWLIGRNEVRNLKQRFGDLNLVRLWCSVAFRIVIIGRSVRKVCYKTHIVGACLVKFIVERGGQSARIENAELVNDVLESVV